MEINRILKIQFIVITMLLIAGVIVQDAFAEDSSRSDKIAVVGDSYAGHFNINEGDERYEYYIFPIAKIDEALNIAIFENAINSDYKYILFASGVNDQALNTDINVFEEILRQYAIKAGEKHKYLFFHTYMDYHKKKYGNGSYPPARYDQVYKKIDEEFENVLYIDMSSFNDARHDWGDGLHYDKFFYDTLNAKLIYNVDSIERNIFRNSKLEVKESNKRQIAVVGDNSADEFFDYESRKHYNLVNFTSSPQLIFQNKEYIIRAINYESQNILITVGKKEYESQVDINEFTDTLRECLNEACLRHKNVFLYASLDYRADLGLPIPIAEYDLILDKVAREYPNTCYINLGNYNKEVPQIYDTLYELLDNLIKNVY